MITFKKYIGPVFSMSCLFCFCGDPSHKSEQTKGLIVIKEEQKDEPYYATEFDFPVGIKNDGKYLSKTDGKEYKGWKIATYFMGKNDFGLHPGEDWNGLGGGNTDAFQPVFATANGIVKSIDTVPFGFGKAIMIEHRLKNGNNIDTLFSVYVHVDSIKCSINQKISMNEPIALIFSGTKEMSAHLHFEIRKSSMKNLPLLFYPSLANKNKEWIIENYYSPSLFISEHKNEKLPK